MGCVGIKELKNRLTTYVRLAKQGEEIVVTERGRPVVLMQALRKTQDLTSLEAKLAGDLSILAMQEGCRRCPEQPQ
jgi:prevent-host-death family protein